MLTPPSYTSQFQKARVPQQGVQLSKIWVRLIDFQKMIMEILYMIKLSIRNKLSSTVYVYNRVLSPYKWLKGPVHLHRCFLLSQVVKSRSGWRWAELLRAGHYVRSCTNKDDKGVIGPTLAGAAKLTEERGNGLHTPTHFWEELLSSKISPVMHVGGQGLFLKKTLSCFEPSMPVCDIQKTPLTVRVHCEQ